MSAPGETYQLPDPSAPKPYLSYGLAFHEAAAWHAKHTFDASRVYVIVSKTISKTKDWTTLQQALERQAGTIVGVRYGIQPHTPWDEVYELTADLKKTQPDLIITLGGGSIIDGVKLARLFAANNILTDSAREALHKIAKADFEDSNAHNKDAAAPATIPSIFIPTSLSGGEWTHFSGATDKHGAKSLFKHVSMWADLVVYDPALTLPLPERFWFSTGVRTIDHCIEGLSSTKQDVENADAIRDVLEDALRKMLPNLLATKVRGYDDLHARLQCQLATVVTARAVAIGVGPSHGIGHQLGPLGVGHGETSCILLPNVLKFNWKHGGELARQRQQRVRKAFWTDPLLREVFAQRGLKEGDADAGDLLDAYLRELGMPRTLKGMGIKKEQFDGLVENSLKDPCTVNGPVEVGKDEVREILEMAWDD